MFPSAEFTSFIDQNKLFKANEQVLLALSGGRDSVLMAHLFNAAGFKFGLAHVNFQLRGAESEADEAFCQQLAEQLEVPFFVTRFDTQAYAAQHSLSIQMAARHLRYEWLENIRQENNYKYIALAHHQNDSIETVLLNLVRGTGISGLHGILPKRDKLIRPLLGFKREDIDAIVEKEGFSYRDDSSNESVKYARNKIRLEVIPKLKELNPALESTFEANLKRFAELEELLHLRVEELRHLFLSPARMEKYTLNLDALKALKPLNTLLFELFRPYGFTESVLKSLTENWHGQSGKVFESASHQLLLDRSQLILSPLEKAEIADVSFEIDEETVFWDNQQFKIELCEISGFNLNPHPAKAALDADLLIFPLTFRSWHLGDVFRPMGMRGKKKLSDFFIEHKIPLSQKKHVGVLQNGNGEIVWIVGLRIDDRYKVGANTKKVFILEQIQ